MDVDGLRPWGALFALVLLAAVEFGFARQTWLWAAFPKSPSGIVDVMEEQVLAPADDPVIVILGNSRTRDAVVPAIVEDGLGLPRRAVLNMSLTAGEPFDSYVLYKRNREKLRRASLIVLAVEEWQLQDSREISERYRRFAALRDRIRYPDRRLKSSLVAGWLWRTFDARKPIGRFIKELILRTDRSAPIGEDGRVVWRVDDPEVGPEEVDLTADLERTYCDFRPERMMNSLGFKYLERTIHMAEQDGLAVALISPPYRDAFAEAREEYCGEDADEVFRRAIWLLAGEHQGVRVLLNERASVLGIPDVYYLDYGHMLEHGAEIYSHLLANWLRETYPELVR